MAALQAVHTAAACSARPVVTARASDRCRAPAARCGSAGTSRRAVRVHVLGGISKLWGGAAPPEEQQEAEAASTVEALEAALSSTSAPAPTNAAAAPASDDDDVAALRQLLGSTALEAAPLVPAYDAARDDWSPDAFHSAVDGRGPALVVALTGACRQQPAGVCGAAPKLHPPNSQPPRLPPPPAAVEGALLGGYNPLGWCSGGGDVESEEAFLFIWPDGDTAQPPITLPKARTAGCGAGCGAGTVPRGGRGGLLLGLPPPCCTPGAPSQPTCLLLCANAPHSQVGGPGRAVVADAPGQGPVFGGSVDGLAVPLKPGAERRAASKLGAEYQRRPGGGRHLFTEGNPIRGGARATELVSLRVYVAAQ